MKATKVRHLFSFVLTGFRQRQGCQENIHSFTLQSPREEGSGSNN